MIDKLGTRKEVEKDIRDHRPKREFAQRLANFSHADEDGNPVGMTKEECHPRFWCFKQRCELQ
jgi:hypothetical protein